MIKTVELYDFQSHKKTVLEMGKLTVLTGGSNSGKSAVLRALGGLLRNDSAGDYVNHGAKTLRVVVTMDTGHIVEWEKGSGTNQYKITTPDGQEDLFQKVGSDIPEEVADVIGIAPITMEGGQRLHINLHEQLESPFLVGKEHTAGFAAKVFGEITSAAKLQASMQEGSRLNRSALSTVKIKRSDLAGIDGKLLHFASLDTDIDALSAASKYTDTAETTEKSRARLDTTVDTINDLNSDISDLEEVEKQLSKLVVVDLAELDKKSQSYNELSQTLVNIGLIDDKVSKLSSFLSADEVDTSLEIASLDRISREAEELEKTFIKAKKVSDEIDKIDAALEIAEKKFATREEDIARLMEDLDECPTCRTALTDDAKSHVLGVHLA